MVGVEDISSIINGLEKYKEKFNKFILEGTSQDISLDNNSFLVRLRHKEWDNYKLFLELKIILNSYSQAKQKVEEIESLIENSLTEKFLNSVEIFIIDESEHSSYHNRDFISGPIEKIFEILSINNLQVLAAKEKGIIHKKVVGKSPEATDFVWLYEVWIDLDTGNIRQEMQTGENKEIDITDGKTQKKLALDPNNKLAEWLNEKQGKFGIGSEETKDPYTQFKNQLKKKECYLEGTDIFEEKEIYMLKCPIYDKDYSIYYISAENYLPLRHMVFYEKHLIEPTEDPLKSKVIKTGEMQLMYDYWFIVAEIIELKSLPDNFFEQIIPEDYKIEDWVPYG